MATTILPFVLRPRAAAKARPAGVDATVIIFPGVRYEPRPDGVERRAQKRAHGPARGKRKSKA